MLALAHAGITLGTAAVLTAAYRGRRHSQAAAPNSSPPDKASWFTLLGRRVDIRLLLVGSLLPDIIDKPVGQVLFRETFSGGRLFSHTLLFLILITLAGLYLYRRYGKNWLLVLAFGTFTHLILDGMWLSPRTLFWPVFGFGFKRIDLTNWLPDMFRALLTDPATYVPELIGLVIVLWFGVALIRRRKLFAFVRYGQVES